MTGLHGLYGQSLTSWGGVTSSFPALDTPRVTTILLPPSDSSIYQQKWNKEFTHTHTIVVSMYGKSMTFIVGRGCTRGARWCRLPAPAPAGRLKQDTRRRLVTVRALLRLLFSETELFFLDLDRAFSPSVSSLLLAACNLGSKCLALVLCASWFIHHWLAPKLNMSRSQTPSCDGNCQ